MLDFMSVECTGQLLDEPRDSIPTGKFVCQNVEYAVPDSSCRFARVLTLAARLDD